MRETFWALVALCGIWLWRFAFRQRTPDVLSLRRAVPAPAPSLAEVLPRVIEELQKADQVLADVDNIGLWVQSDDSSDNRKKREGLRQADWAVSYAGRMLAEAQPKLPELAQIETDIHALVALLEPLPDQVTDTMGLTSSVRSEMFHAQRVLREIVERLERQ